MEHSNKMSKREAGRLGNERMKEIARVAREQKIAAYNQNPNLCEQCGNPIPYHQKNQSSYRFCSTSCAAIHNNTGRKLSVETRQKISDTLAKAGNGLSRSVDRHCQNCGSPIPRYCDKFCSTTCRSEYYWKLRKEQIEKTGEFPATTHDETDRKIARRYMEEVRGHKCAICGIETWRGESVPLVVDHIDGNAMNHDVTNLRLLCPNCDAQLPTFKNRPHEAHREFRRKESDVVTDSGNNFEMPPVTIEYGGTVHTVFR